VRASESCKGGSFRSPQAWGLSILWLLCAPGKDAGVRPDWAHVFLSVLPLLPLHNPKDRAKIASALRQGVSAAFPLGVGFWVLDLGFSLAPLALSAPSAPSKWLRLVAFHLCRDEGTLGMGRQGCARGLDRIVHGLLCLSRHAAPPLA
jgi:hypothetical protein